MKIAFLNSLYPPHGQAGAETTLRLLVSNMRGRGHDCAVITLTPEPGMSVGEVDGAPVHYLPLANVYWPHGRSRPKALRPVFQAIEADNPVMRRRLSAVLGQIRPDVMNAHNLQGFSASAWRAASGLGVPTVQTVHDYYTACPRSAMWRPGLGNCASLCRECRVFGAPRRRLSRLPDAVTCVSHRVFDRLSGAGAYPAAITGAQPVRIIRGNNADDALPPVPEPAAGGTLRIGFLGRLDPSKGIEALIAAVKRLPAGTAHLRIAGGGLPDYRRELEDAAAGSPAVEFLGHVVSAEFLPTVDLLVIASTWEDPFPRVFHEALAYGVPSLVAPRGGLPEVITDGANGFILGEGPDALFERLQALAAQGWDRRAMFAACRAAAANYSPSHIGDQYEAVLRAAASRSAVPPDAGEPWRGQAGAAA